MERNGHKKKDDQYHLLMRESGPASSLETSRNTFFYYYISNLKSVNFPLLLSSLPFTDQKLCIPLSIHTVNKVNFIKQRYNSAPSTTARTEKKKETGRGGRISLSF